MHEAFRRQVLLSKGVDNIQCHHNSHQRVCGFLQERVVKHPSVEYWLCKDDTQAPTMASDRLFFVMQAAIELQKSNADWPPSSLYSKRCHGPLWPWPRKIHPMDGWRVYRPALRRTFNLSSGQRPCFDRWLCTHEADPPWRLPSPAQLWRAPQQQNQDDWMRKLKKLKQLHQSGPKDNELGRPVQPSDPAWWDHVSFLSILLPHHSNHGD